MNCKDVTVADNFFLVLLIIKKYDKGGNRKINYTECGVSTRK